MEQLNTTKEEKCRNCGTSFVNDQSYCNHCGQKTKGITLELKDLLTNLWESVFNLDNSFFKSLRFIWAPWKLTNFYVAGKRKSFLNPVRLFLVTLLLHFGLFTSLTNLDNRKTGTVQEYLRLEKSKLLEKHHNFLSDYAANEYICNYADSLNEVLFKGVKLPNDQQFTVLGNDFSNIKFLGIKEYPITVKDAIELPSDSLFSKYGVETFWEKLVIKQSIRLNLDRAGALKYVIGNIAWGIIPVILMLALVMKLLYIRHKRYYAEHVILLMNVHSLAFILVSGAIVGGYIFDNLDDLQPVVYVVVLLMMFLSLYFYFNQGIFKTLIKYCTLGFTYFFLLVFCLLIAGIVSLFMY